MSSALIYALIYFGLVVLGSWFFFRGKVKTAEDFTRGGQTLSWFMVGSGLALIPLGSGHTMSLWEASAGLGASVLFGRLSSAVSFCRLPCCGSDRGFVI